MFTAVLGNGNADVRKHIINGCAYDIPIIKTAMKNRDAWKSIFNKLWDIGFR